MKKLLQVIILFNLCFTVFASEVNGFLSLENEVDKVKVGEFYRYKLILVPFDIEDLKPGYFLDKPFIDLFHVSKINNAFISSENADAVVVELDMALSKEVELKDLYIWQLGSLNIPIQLKFSFVEGTDLIQRNFSIMERRFSLPDSINWAYLVIALSLILLGVIFFYVGKSKVKRRNKEIEGFNLEKALSEGEDHEKLEKLYRNRLFILNRAREKGVESEFDSFFKAYEKKQYSPSWRESDVSDLIKEAKELSGEISHGS